MRRAGLQIPSVDKLSDRAILAQGGLEFVRTSTLCCWGALVFSASCKGLFSLVGLSSRLLVFWISWALVVEFSELSKLFSWNWLEELQTTFLLVSANFGPRLEFLDFKSSWFLPQIGFLLNFGPTKTKTQLFLSLFVFWCKMDVLYDQETLFLFDVSIEYDRVFHWMAWSFTYWFNDYNVHLFYANSWCFLSFWFSNNYLIDNLLWLVNLLLQFVKSLELRK